MDQKAVINEEAGSSRGDTVPTTQRVTESKREISDVEDAVIRTRAVAARVERFEKGETLEEAHAAKQRQPRGVSQQKSIRQESDCRKQSGKDKSIKALEAKHANEMLEKEREIEAMRLELERMRKEEIVATNDRCDRSSRAAAWLQGDTSCTESENSVKQYRVPNDSESDSEPEEMPLTRRQIFSRKCLQRSLPSFSGVPEESPLFISSFKDTNKACGFSNLENLQRLRDSLRGDALEAVKGRLVLAASVPDIIEELRNLFGRPRRILKSLLCKVRTVNAPDARTAWNRL